MKTFALDKDAYLATLAEPMRDVTNEATNVLDIWSYVAAVPTADLRGHSIYDDLVEFVYRHPKDRFDHVLEMTTTKNVYLAVIVDLQKDCIHGHHLLNLNKEYGLIAE
jgi:hypothetical protein